MQPALDRGEPSGLGSRYFNQIGLDKRDTCGLVGRWSTQLANGCGIGWTAMENGRAWQFYLHQLASGRFSKGPP